MGAILYTVVTSCLLLSTIAAPNHHGYQKIHVKAIQRSDGIQKINRHSHKSGAAQVPLVDFFKGTDLQWIGNVEIGSPPQTFSAVFDTGSPTFLIPSADCTPANGCAKDVSKFNPSRSRTFNLSSNTPFEFSFFTGGGVTPGNESQSGFLNTDRVSIGGLTVDNQEIGLVDSATPGFAPFLKHFQAVIGLGSAADLDGARNPILPALVAAGELLEPIVSFYIPPRSTGHAELTLGAIDHSKFVGDIHYIRPAVTDGLLASIWNVNFTNIFVNGRPTGVANFAVLDTGTSNIVAPSNDDAAAIYKHISIDIKLLNETGVFGIACERICELPATLDFEIEGRKYTIPSRDFNAGPIEGHPGMCQTVINGGDVGFWILGGSLLKHYYSTFNVETKVVGLAKAVEEL
ncbi:acid protease [Rhizodiscina lignyota]|uniref:Acid protease n=1 Tax=Rhizodiscina lignyota TaxID=1504668 RepID=A0A9P4IFD6_9PEZI|nr:acid protease [Rhizodiscina lignyota]